MLQADRSKLIPHVDYLEKELPFLAEYVKEIDWRVYELQRSKRFEIERWVENLINATLDISKMVLTIMGDEIPETSREVLFKIGSRIYEKEEEAETFSELAKIRNTLAHRYLDLRWNYIKRFLEIAPNLYPRFIYFTKREMEKDGSG
ncbi:MAG: DUF86 domain-containing protein [Thermodesulfobacteriota bacterium]|nr:DUF86 domain-containing protein [Thermodesulfobacteriota bacterium]